MLGYELAGLDSSQLAKLWLGVVADDLQKGVERRRRGVVGLVERRGGRLDTFGVG